MRIQQLKTFHRWGTNSEGEFTLHSFLKDQSESGLHMKSHFGWTASLFFSHLLIGFSWKCFSINYLYPNPWLRVSFCFLHPPESSGFVPDLSVDSPFISINLQWVFMTCCQGNFKHSKSHHHTISESKIIKCGTNVGIVLLCINEVTYINLLQTGNND